MIECVEPRSTVVSMQSKEDMPSSLLSPLTKRDAAIDSRLTKSSKTILVKCMSMGTIARQFTARKRLQNRLGLLSDFMCFLGLLGVILMVINNELIFRSKDDRQTNIRWFIKLIMTLSTLALVSLVIFYHYSNIRLYAMQNSLDDCRVGLTMKRILLIIFEIIICTIHPIPRSFPLHWFAISQDMYINTTIVNPMSDPSYISTDVALGLPMFARLYLICRCIMFHSPFVRDASSKSLGSFNQISIDFLFLIKTYLVRWPARCMMISCCLMFFVGSWSIRACDYKSADEKHISFFDSMWLFIITFTTVGYGDITPSTYCGRTMVSVIALFGLSSSALLISVLARKLEFTRWEKYVHKFVLEMEFIRQRREQAANVIKFAIKVWYIRRKQKRRRTLQYFRTQRLLHHSIDSQRTIKQNQRKLHENCLDFGQAIDIQRYTSIKTKKIARDINTIKTTIETIERQFIDVNNTIKNIQNTLDLIVKN